MCCRLASRCWRCQPPIHRRCWWVPLASPPMRLVRGCQHSCARGYGTQPPVQMAWFHAQQAELDALTEEPHHVMLCPETVSLLGVKQYFDELPGMACMLLAWWTTVLLHHQCAQMATRAATLHVADVCSDLCSLPVHQRAWRAQSCRRPRCSGCCGCCRPPPSTRRVLHLPTDVFCGRACVT